MTNGEFKAWFEGFSEGIEDKPNGAQWKRIKAKVKELDNTPLNPQIVREYYRDWWQTYPAPYRPYLYASPTIFTSGVTPTITTGYADVVGSTVYLMGRTEALEAA